MENKEVRIVQLVKVVDCMYNDQIGGNENAMLDGVDYYAWKLEELIDWITDQITNAEGYLEMEDTMEMVEARHFRFLGKEEIKTVVTARCNYRKQKEGRWEWEKKTIN